MCVGSHYKPACRVITGENRSIPRMLLGIRSFSLEFSVLFIDPNVFLHHLSQKIELIARQASILHVSTQTRGTKVINVNRRISSSFFF